MVKVTWDNGLTLNIYVFKKKKNSTINKDNSGSPVLLIPFVMLIPPYCHIYIYIYIQVNQQENSWFLLEFLTENSSLFEM